MKSFIIQNKFRNIIIFLFWILIWEICSLIINQEIYLPSPVQTFKALIKLLDDRNTYITIMYTSYRALVGFLLSCVLGILFGICSGMNKHIYDFLNPFVNIIRTTPVMSVIIIALLWFKDTNVPIFVGFLICFPIMWTSVVLGIENTDEKLIQMSKVYNVKESRIIKSVYMYSSLPYIKSGMISSLGLSWKSVSAAEVLSLPKYAIGNKLYDSKVYLEIPNLFAWTVIIIILSILFEKILKKCFELGEKND